MEAIIAYANEPTINGRIYSKEVLEDLAKQINEKEFNPGGIGERTKFGSVVNMDYVSHNIKKAWMEGNVLKADIRLFGTYLGQELIKLLNEDKVVFRACGMGTVGDNGSVYDLVSINAIDKNDDAFGNAVKKETVIEISDTIKIE